MSEFLPYAGANSVQEVIAGIHFQRSLGLGNVDRFLATVKPELTEFHRFNPIRLQEISLNVSDLSPNEPQKNQPNPASGFEFISLGHDGKPERVIRYIPGNLTAHFTKYNGWKNILPASLRYLRELVLVRLDLETNPVAAISLRFIDKYTYTGNSDEACPQFLFRSNTSHIAAHCFRTRGAWHCNTGWFEEELEKWRTLNQLNIENRIIDGSAVVTIDHSGTCYLQSPRKSTAEIDSTSVPEAGFEGILNKLHARNKSILQGILQDDMLQRIGVMI